MARVSLKEAYDNKDVVTQIFGLRDEVDKHSEILENLPDPDLTNCVLKTGDQTIAGEKTFTDKIHAEGGLELDTEGGFEVNGTLTVNGDIVQNGEAYETHAEQVFSQNDLIVTRDGAVSALPAGVVSGIQVKKYDGVNDARLAVDNAGVARVGDVGDEQPLMTRAEVADMIGGSFLKWDSQHARAVSGTLDDAPTAGSSNGVKSSGIKNAVDTVQNNVDSVQNDVDILEQTVAGKVSGTGDIGNNTKPVKIVNGVAVPIAKDVITVDGGTFNTNKPLVFICDPYNASIQIRANTTDGQNIQILNVLNSQNVSLVGLYLSYDNTNGVRLNASVRNADGTYRYVPIA